MRQLVLDHSDVYFVTNLQVDTRICSLMTLTLFHKILFVQIIQWMQNPVDSNGLRDFDEWKEKCDVKGLPYCSLPNACPLNTRELPGEVLRLHTCMECPNNYPWLLDPTGDGFNF